MIIKEEQRNLFTVPQGYYLAHCISGDCKLGAGIAKRFDEIYNMKFKLHHFFIDDNNKLSVGESYLVDNVFNLVTKLYYYNKPTYDTLYEALSDMKEDCIYLHIDKIAIPRIGCGLDKLNWEKVKNIIENIFEDTNIEILVCTL